MAEIPPPPVPTQLIVFADDWGRHPSSTQHLIRELLPQYPTLWVNTVGTRRPRLCWADIKRGFKKFASILSASDGVLDHMDPGLPENLYVIEPLMYPGFRTCWQRRFNRAKLTRSIHQCFGETFATKPLFERNPSPTSRRVVVTTLPITADLVSVLHADRWVYYCVDDYTSWPGVDHHVMDAMERDLVMQVDAVTCVSEMLASRVRSRDGVSPSILSHGVDASWWTEAIDDQSPRLTHQADGFMDLNGSPILFWGLIDERLDKSWIADLSQAICQAPLNICLVGPTVGDQQAWQSLTYDRNAYGDVVCCGKVDYELLPTLASFCTVLIMPYIDAPVTRAMQPLKLKEYLATMKPVVVRDLPSTRAWADCCDLAGNADDFVRLVKLRVETGLPDDQRQARERRLASESWTAKAAQLAALINEGASPPATGSG